MSDETRLVIIYAGTAPEAGYLKSILEAEGIPAVLKDEMMGSIAAPYIAAGGLGAVKVLVAERDRERAMEYVKDFQSPSGADPRE